MTSTTTALLALAMFLLPVAGHAQNPSATDDTPEWLFADSLFVEHPQWISGTVAKDILILLFRDGTSRSRRTAILRQIHGRVVFSDHFYWDEGYYYVRVPSHPDACGVKQALDVLNHMSDVEMATVHSFFLGESDGGLADPGATHKGSKQPCPLGTSLLR